MGSIKEDGSPCTRATDGGLAAANSPTPLTHPEAVKNVAVEDGEGEKREDEKGGEERKGLRKVGLIGSGPTTLFTLYELSRRHCRPAALTIFEAQAEVGLGGPYSPVWNTPSMLANISSAELPALPVSLQDWLKTRSKADLERLRIQVGPKGELDERGNQPRLALGEYFRDQFQNVLEELRAQSHSITVRTSSRVVDMENVDDGVLLTVRPVKALADVLSADGGARRGEPDDFVEKFDHALIATGHFWPAKAELRPGYFLSPWPASNLAAVPPVSIGIRGTSLTAIDAVVALAEAHGSFVRNEGRTTYEPKPNTEGFRITLLSRKGLLPEADFYHPFPWDPLEICTEEAVTKLIARAQKSEAERAKLLDNTLALFLEELARAAPDYIENLNITRIATPSTSTTFNGSAQPTGVNTEVVSGPFVDVKTKKPITVEDFGARFFAHRLEAGAFAWAERNLKEAQDKYIKRETVPYQSAVFRMQNVVGMIVAHLNLRDFERFTQNWRPLHMYNDGAVAHESIRRLLALRDASPTKLRIVRLGENYHADTTCMDGGARVHFGRENRTEHFPVFIECTGQGILEASDFPFPTLRRQGIIRDNCDESSHESSFDRNSTHQTSSIENTLHANSVDSTQAGSSASASHSFDSQTDSQSSGEDSDAGKNCQSPVLARAVVSATLSGASAVTKASATARGIAVDEQLQPLSKVPLPRSRIFFMSIPFLLGIHPFIQGIWSSQEMGAIVANQLAKEIGVRKI